LNYTNITNITNNNITNNINSIVQQPAMSKWSVRGIAVVIPVVVLALALMVCPKLAQTETS
jgi:hypothetical protein